MDFSYFCRGYHPVPAGTPHVYYASGLNTGIFEHWLHRPYRLELCFRAKSAGLFYGHLHSFVRRSTLSRFLRTAKYFIRTLFKTRYGKISQSFPVSVCVVPFSLWDLRSNFCFYKSGFLIDFQILW